MTATLPLDLFKGWLASGERGLSSEAIVIALTGESWWSGSRYGRGSEPPRDPADLRRCMKLLEAVPLARVSLPVMRSVSPQWAALVDHWDELTALLTEEIPDILHAARVTAGRAPRTYARMQDLLHNRPSPALAEAPNDLSGDTPPREREEILGRRNEGSHRDPEGAAEVGGRGHQAAGGPGAAPAPARDDLLAEAHGAGRADHAPPPRPMHRARRRRPPLRPPDAPPGPDAQDPLLRRRALALGDRLRTTHQPDNTGARRGGPVSARIDVATPIRAHLHRALARFAELERYIAIVGTASDCSRKRRYTGLTRALQALDRISEKRAAGARTTEQRAYHCPHCDGWHLTSQPKRNTRNPRNPALAGEETP